jgi:alanine-glyoxylate transaminase/serine-glyoxylate transaminase/serine-pyruvate transaminase
MGSGPSEVPARVLTAMARPTIGHHDPAFSAMMEDIKALLPYAFQTNRCEPRKARSAEASSPR